MRRQLRPVPAWLDSIRPGDVLRFRTGTLRTVLDVSHRPNGTVHSVMFAIRHCSWTNRGYTIIDRAGLLDRVDGPTNARINLARQPIAQRLLEDARHPVPHTGITCCEVIGVFE